MWHFAVLNLIIHTNERWNIYKQVKQTQWKFSWCYLLAYDHAKGYCISLILMIDMELMGVFNWSHCDMVFEVFFWGSIINQIIPMYHYINIYNLLLMLIPFDIDLNIVKLTAGWQLWCRPTWRLFLDCWWKQLKSIQFDNNILVFCRLHICIFRLMVKTIVFSCFHQKTKNNFLFVFHHNCQLAVSLVNQ